MRLNNRTIVVVLAAVALVLIGAVATRGQGSGLLARIAAMHGHGR